MPTVTHLCTESNSSTLQRATPKRDSGTRGRRPSCCRWPPCAPAWPGHQHPWSGSRQATRRAPRPRRQLATRPSFPAVPAPRGRRCDFLGAGATLGEERRGLRGGRGWGAEFQSPAVCPSPGRQQGSRALCNAALTQGTEPARRGYTTYSTTQVLFLHCNFLSQRPPQSAPA